MAEEKKKKNIDRMPVYFMVAAGLFVIIVIIIALLTFFYFGGFGLFYHTSTSTKAPFKCTTDSQCASGSYCSSFGACLNITCGDGICSTSENQSGSCPIDCGCSAGQVLNKHSNQCQQSLSVSTDVVKTAVNDYLSQNNITGVITSISDSYYGDQAVKDAEVNCQQPGDKNPCQITFYIDSNGKIVNTVQTT